MLRAFYTAGVMEAGLDEAGRGCLAGPVVAAAVIFPPDFWHPLLNDSKQLSKTQREEARQVVLSHALAWSVAEASPTEIDQINILQASFLAMHRAVAALSTVPEHLLVDGNRFVPYPLIPHTCIIKGDAKYLSIAAASILAKTQRDAYMEKLATDYPQYGWEQNAGYPTAQHRSAIAAHGITPFHRRSFRLVK